MIRVIIASENKTKIQAVRDAFGKMFPQADMVYQGVAVPSGVSEQPLSDGETLEGAYNRAENAKQLYSNFDFWVGIEGGVQTVKNEMEVFAWIVILSKQRIGKAKTGTFQLPEEIKALIEEGYELGVADDMLFQRTNSKNKNGAVGILTNDVLDRTNYYAQAIILALIPFMNKDLYPENKI